MGLAGPAGTGEPDAVRDLSSRNHAKFTFRSPRDAHALGGFGTIRRS
ncbi:hypothetical protein I547_5301 [Mycobacterium kansasii 824]|nr:hypothetical protein I547_5301 [Mycobacterium kansasii 824]